MVARYNSIWAWIKLVVWSIYFALCCFSHRLFWSPFWLICGESYRKSFLSIFRIYVRDYKYLAGSFFCIYFHLLPSRTWDLNINSSSYSVKAWLESTGFKWNIHLSLANIKPLSHLLGSPRELGVFQFYPF